MSTILVVEDMQGLRDEIVTTLQFEGFRVLVGGDGQQGVALAQQYHPDLVLCDIMMPLMDGYQTLEALRNHPATAAIPFIFLTAKADRSDVRQGMELGADDYISKPFTMAELVRAVKARLHTHKTMHQHAEEQLSRLRSNLSMALPHEMRTPLNGIMVGTELLLEEGATMTPRDIHEIAQIMNLSALRLRRLIEHVLLYTHIEMLSTDASRIAELRTTLTSVSPPVLESWCLTQTQEARRSADFDFDFGDVMIPMREDHIVCIVQELVDNACKFSDPTSMIRIRANKRDGKLVFSVTNQGCGMTEEQISSIGAYTQFDRRIREQQGLGLGLIITKRLIELYGGQLLIDSEPNFETTVSVLLPEPLAS